MRVHALVLVLAAITGTAACRKSNPPAPKVAPPTLAEAEAFAREFAKHMAPCEATALDKDIDFDVIITRAVAGRNVSEPQVRQLRREAAGAGALLCNQLGPDAQYTYLRTQDMGGEPRPLFRVLTGGGVNYHQLELDKSKGGVRAADLYIFMTGERMSETFGVLIETLVSTRAAQSHVTALQRVKEQIAAQDFAGAKGSLAALPEKVRNTKAVMLQEVQVASELTDEAEYLAVIDRYSKAFPNDPSLDLVQVDGAILRKKYDEELAILDRLDKRLGGDPYLDVLRADALSNLGKLDEAIVAAKRATVAEPTLEQAWWQLLTQQAAADKHADALVTLDKLRDQFKADVGDAALCADERFTRLVATKEYAAWRAKTPEPAAKE